MRLCGKAMKAVGSDAGAEQPTAGGLVVHYAMGVLPAMLYARLRTRHPALRRGRGALYGFVLYLVDDLVAARVLAIASPQSAYPWQAHAREIVGRVVLGIGIEGWLEALEAHPPQEWSGSNRKRTGTGMVCHDNSACAWPPFRRQGDRQGDWCS